MPEDKLGSSSEIKETDIIFECPFCGKSMAIDFRGAGLMVPCVDCGKWIQVPNPNSPSKVSAGEYQTLSAQIEELRKMLAQAKAKNDALENEIANLKAMKQKNLLPQNDTYPKTQIMERLNKIYKLLDEISSLLEKNKSF